MRNVVISIDERESKLKLAFGKNEYREFEFAKTESGQLNYKDIIASALSEFSKAENLRITGATYVLPDELVLYDLIKTPIFFGKSQKDLIGLEIGTRYPHQDQYEKLLVPVSKSNGQMFTVAIMTLGKRVESIKDAFKVNKISLNDFTFESAMIADAYLSVETKKRGVVLFAAIEQNETKVVVVKDRSLLFFTSIPYGNNLLELKGELDSVPSVLNKAEFTVKESSDNVNNSKYLVRTLMEMKSTLSEKYRFLDISVKYSVDDKYADLFNGSDMERVLGVPSRPELTKLVYNKGLIF